MIVFFTFLQDHFGKKLKKLSKTINVQGTSPDLPSFGISLAVGKTMLRFFSTKKQDSTKHS
jgi:hypothetical protein